MFKQISFQGFVSILGYCSNMAVSESKLSIEQIPLLELKISLNNIKSVLNGIKTTMSTNVLVFVYQNRQQWIKRSEFIWMEVNLVTNSNPNMSFLYVIYTIKKDDKRSLSKLAKPLAHKHRLNLVLGSQWNFKILM